jgi:hypothetical protein
MAPKSAILGMPKTFLRRITSRDLKVRVVAHRHQPPPGYFRRATIVRLSADARWKREAPYVRSEDVAVGKQVRNSLEHQTGLLGEGTCRRQSWTLVGTHRCTPPFYFSNRYQNQQVPQPIRRREHVGIFYNPGLLADPWYARSAARP